ncbi:tumor necrosis factor receptor superfamily member 12A [Mixophyes fleayi]|uniref:tumor necrosis factor receptor superfamily member 12A n=1 Tax=Mixophyes fleayi TaxID=3061075 RepID=UPI003F4E3A11
MMKVWNVLQSLLLLLLVEMSREEATDLCPKGWEWSPDLGKCKDCTLCEAYSKDDFCQTCESTEKGAVFPWLIVGCATGSVVVIFSFVLGLTIYMTRFRRKSKFTTPIEETGAHSAEELLIH